MTPEKEKLLYVASLKKVLLDFIATLNADSKGDWEHKNIDSQQHWVTKTIISANMKNNFLGNILLIDNESHKNAQTIVKTIIASNKWHATRRTTNLLKSIIMSL